MFYLSDGNTHNGKFMICHGSKREIEAEPVPYDVVCPVLPGKEPNMYSKSCLVKLQLGSVPWDCRRCEVGKKLRTEHLPDFVKPSEQVRRCKCGAKLQKRCSTCADCKKANKAMHRKKFAEKRAKERDKKRAEKRSLLEQKKAEIEKQLEQL
jgi:hypothetical protein